MSASSTEMKVEQLKEMMIGKVSIFQDTGVGKSTLVNAMEPSLHLKQSDLVKASSTLRPLQKCMTYFWPKLSIRLVLKVLGSRYGAS
jgi:predicted GTPase